MGKTDVGNRGIATFKEKFLKIFNKKINIFKICLIKSF